MVVLQKMLHTSQEMSLSGLEFFQDMRATGSRISVY